MNNKRKFTLLILQEGDKVLVALLMLDGEGGDKLLLQSEELCHLFVLLALEGVEEISDN